MGYSIEREDDIIIVSIVDRLDIEDSMDLEDEINEKVDNDSLYFVINFEQAEYLSSTGIRLLIGLANRLKEKSGILVLSELSEGIDKILDLVDIKKIFVIKSTNEEAFEYINEKL